MDTTFHLLLMKGYDGVSISDIQKASGMARGLLYHYFGSKEALFSEVIEHYCLNMFSPDLKRIRNFNIEKMIRYLVERYREICSTAYGGTQERREVSIMNYDFLFYRAMQEDENFCRKYSEMRSNELLAWETIMHNTIIQGSLREGLDPKRTARNFVYLMDGVWMNAVVTHYTHDLIDDLAEVLQDYYLMLKK